MNRNKVRLKVMRILIVFVIMFPSLVKADHYYGGFINYTHVSGFTYNVEVITYADNDKVNSDRDSIKFKWGDGFEEFLVRNNNGGNGETVYPGVKKNIYLGTHTFLQEGNYRMVFQDMYRPFDVTNIEAGKSGSTMLYFDAIIAVADTLSYCINTSAKITYEPYFWIKSGDPFQMNLTHYDEEGDSLSFKLINPKALNGISVPGYWRPNGVALDKETGLFTWDNPTWGIFTFAYEIQEFRDGVQIGHSVVDFPVFVDSSEDERGLFSTITNTTDLQYFFTGSGNEKFSVSYENQAADSVFIEVDGGFAKSAYFTYTEVMNSTGKIAFDTLDLNYLGNDKQQGGHIITFRSGSVFGSDTIFDFKSFLVETNSDTTWGCTVPPNIKEVEKIAPDVPTLTISPNLFEENVWMNLGTSFGNMTVEIFDLRGRLVYRKSDFSEQTVELQLGHLNSALYLFRVRRDNEIITVLKAVKK